jgi:peptidoglycan hydrolase-like protein with peptidoglycan-binding domain
MPVSNTIRTLAKDGRLSLADANAIKQGVAAGTISKADAKQAAERYTEATDSDAAEVLADTFNGAPRSRLTSLPEGFENQPLQKGMRSEAVATLQRALMAAGLGSSNQSMALGSGADGIFGGETEKSVRAFQKASGLPETGKADRATLVELKKALAGTIPTNRPAATTPPVAVPAPSVRPTTGLRRPETTAPAATTAAPGVSSSIAGGTTAPVGNGIAAKGAAPTVGVTLPVGIKPGTPEALAAAGRSLATGDRSANYGLKNAWKNIDPNHAAGVDRRMGGLVDRWKCNLFGGNALAAAGFEPPYYGNKGKGEYPVADQWQQWSTPSAEYKARAAAEGKPVVDLAKAAKNPSRFDLMDSVRPAEIADPAVREQKIAEFLSRVQPGDIVTADHVSQGSDGGHVRVCVGRDPDGRPVFAHAQVERAEVQAQGVNDAGWAGEQALYILRPNTPRTTPASN